MLLGSDHPFAKARQKLAHFTGTTIAAATARRLTEAAGAAAVRLDLAEVARLEADPTAAVPAGAPVQQVSVDGVFVPVVSGEWREVKVLAIGTVSPDGAGGVETTGLSYLARLADHARFGREALAELHRRGTLGAPTVVAVADGADWIQGFWDLHVPTAVRVLDFAHAAGYLARAAQAAFGPGTGETSAWLDGWLHELKHGDPDRVLAALAALPAGATRDEATRYLTERRDQLRYAACLAAGYPIGSGCVESAGKLLVQGRLCGAGDGSVAPSPRSRAFSARSRRTSSLRRRTCSRSAPTCPAIPPPPAPPVQAAIFAPCSPRSEQLRRSYVIAK